MQLPKVDINGEQPQAALHNYYQTHAVFGHSGPAPHTHT